jgi:N-acyl-D-amino-acid deacylase
MLTELAREAKRMDDLLIRGATVVDGTGGAPRSVDVAVRDGRISAVEARRAENAAREVDGTGRVLAPGFIDIHTHSDFTLPLNRLAEAKVRQGSPPRSSAIAAFR